jgi:hypothetical protein
MYAYSRSLDKYVYILILSVDSKHKHITAKRKTKFNVMNSKHCFDKLFSMLSRLQLESLPTITIIVCPVVDLARDSLN